METRQLLTCLVLISVLINIVLSEPLLQNRGKHLKKKNHLKALKSGHHGKKILTAARNYSLVDSMAEAPEKGREILKDFEESTPKFKGYTRPKYTGSTKMEYLKAYEDTISEFEDYTSEDYDQDGTKPKELEEYHVVYENTEGEEIPPPKKHDGINPKGLGEYHEVYENTDGEEISHDNYAKCIEGCKENRGDSSIEILTGAKCDKRRPIQEGDYISPKDFYPLAKEVLSKAKSEGHSLYENITRAEFLADAMFRSFYFGTPRRIMKVDAQSVHYLDELQSLVAEEKATVGEYKSTCSYIVMSKPDGQGNAVTRRHIKKSRLSRPIKLPPLPPGGKRKLIKIVRNRSNRKKLGEGKKKKTRTLQKVSGPTSKGKKTRTLQKISGPSKGKKTRTLQKISGSTNKPINSSCTWQYKCKDKNDIDSCKLEVVCDKKKSRRKPFNRVQRVKTYNKPGLRTKYGPISDAIKQIINERRQQNNLPETKLEPIQHYYDALLYDQGMQKGHKVIKTPLKRPVVIKPKGISAGKLDRRCKKFYENDPKSEENLAGNLDENPSANQEESGTGNVAETGSETATNT